MRRCSGCGKRRIKSATLPQSPAAPGNWASKADLGWPQVEFTGGNKNDLVFKGKVTRRKYKAGNNQYHKVIRVHPQDFEGFVAMRYFEEYKGQKSERLVSAPTPKPPPTPRAKPKKEEPVKPTPPPVSELDITTMKVRDVLQYDFSHFNPRAMDILIGQEEKREPKPRSTIVKYLERQKRGLSAKKEEKDGTRKSTNAVVTG